MAVKTGIIVGYKPYSIKSEKTGRLYEGYRLCILVDPSGDSDEDKDLVGNMADVASISLRDLGPYDPQLSDHVRYHVYMTDKGKSKYGFIMPIE